MGRGWGLEGVKSSSLEVIAGPKFKSSHAQPHPSRLDIGMQSSPQFVFLHQTVLQTIQHLDSASQMTDLSGRGRGSCEFDLGCKSPWTDRGYNGDSKSGFWEVPSPGP